MNIEDLLQEVRKCKELGVEAVITESHGADLLFRVSTDALLTENRTQILDILDDAIQAHLEGKW